MYKQLKSISGEVSTYSVLRLSDMAIVPFDPANTDYQEYLKWVAEGNEPIAADGE